MSLNMTQPASDYGRHVVLGSRPRPVKIRDAVYSRLLEMAEDDDDCDFARWLLLQVCEIFRDDIDGQTAAVPTGVDGREYIAGWEDALATIRGLSSLCLKGPPEDAGASRSEPAAESSDSCGDTEQSHHQSRALGTEWNKRWESMDWGNETLMHCHGVDMTPWSPSAFGDSEREPSSSQVSQASSSLINTPSNVSISDSVFRALFPPSSPADSSSSSSSSSSSASSSSPRRAPSSPGSRQPPDEHRRNLNKSDIIRGLDTNALLTHFERQSRLSERRIVAELGRTSLLRQAIFQDRFFGRVPSFAGGSGGDDVGDDECIADGIDEPFLGDAQQVRAVRQVKTLFRQWRKAAVEDRVGQDGDSDGGARMTGGEEDSDDGVSSLAASSSQDPEPWVGTVSPPSPGSESVYTDDSLWPSADPEPDDETSALVAPPTHHYFPQMADGPSGPETGDSSHDHTRLDESGPSSG
ncbi:hypothetical protein LX32DRAFT_588431 [Colletotrichum zoysiae]|uniref:Uncharacterized protein n=1 Tax=Colletotrichum zoysiae TaxID=1216348 RepID=A0AAD9HIL6_9PEZI|nr:hypothetical protein LX32DRAFT_588431 [Colletotrichum zoysiae]